MNGPAVSYNVLEIRLTVNGSSVEKVPNDCRKLEMLLK